MNDVESKECGEDGRHKVAIQTDTYAIDRTALGDDLPGNYWMSPGFIGTVAGLSLGNISTYSTWVMPSNSLTIINQDLGPSTQISWVALAYTLGLSVGFLLVGRLSDIFGRRWFFIAGNGFALICGIVGATAQNVNSLIGGNVLGGLAGAVQLSFAAAIAEIVQNKHRPVCIAAFFLTSIEFAAFGPVIAQAFVTNTAAGWRWSYYINILVSGSAVLCLFCFYHPPTFRQLHANRSRIEQFKRQDFIGFTLFTSGLILFIMGLSWGGVSYPWCSAHVIATIVIGAFLLVAFVLWSRYGHPGDPLLPLHLFKSRGYLAMVVTATVGSCVYYSMNVLWPQQIEYLLGGDAIHRGWLACVVGGAVLLGQLVGACLCRYIRQSRWILTASCLSLLAFCGSMISINPGEQSRGVGLMFMACFSVGVIEICSLALLPLSLPSEDIGAALGALGSIRSGGASVATAVYTTILNNKLSHFVPDLVTAAASGAGLPSRSLSSLLEALANGNISLVPGMTPEISVAVEAASAEAGAQSFRYVWYAVIAFAGVAVVASFLTIDYGQFLDERVERKLQVTAQGVKRGGTDNNRQTGETM